MQIEKGIYPIQFDVDYSERLSRWKTLFRLILIIPIWVIVLLLNGISITPQGVSIAAGGFLFLPPLLMILFRKKYPGWWFDWNLEFTRFQQRIAAYLFLLTDQYPSTDEEQRVHLTIVRPQREDLMRGMPLIKWFLAIPHFIVLMILGIIAIILWILAWFSILIIGRYPRPLFNYMVGYMRWSLRVLGYCILLVTDRYPPFSMK